MPRSLAGSKTHQNLRDAFAAESQANRRYLYFARRANNEGFPEVAALFRDTSEAVSGHAFGHLDFLKDVGDPCTELPVGDTASNLRSAIKGETTQRAEMYPAMARIARDEGFDEIAEWFETLARAEAAHAARFQKGLDDLSADR